MPISKRRIGQQAYANTTCHHAVATVINHIATANSGIIGDIGNINILHLVAKIERSGHKTSGVRLGRQNLTTGRLCNIQLLNRIALSAIATYQFDG